MQIDGLVGIPHLLFVITMQMLCELHAIIVQVSEEKQASPYKCLWMHSFRHLRGLSAAGSQSSEPTSSQFTGDLLRLAARFDKSSLSLTPVHDIHISSTHVNQAMDLFPLQCVSRADRWVTSGGQNRTEKT